MQPNCPELNLAQNGRRGSSKKKRKGKKKENQWAQPEWQFAPFSSGAPLILSTQPLDSCPCHIIQQRRLNAYVHAQFFAHRATRSLRHHKSQSVKIHSIYGSNWIRHGPQSGGAGRGYWLRPVTQSHQANTFIDVLNQCGHLWGTNRSTFIQFLCDSRLKWRSESAGVSSSVTGRHKEEMTIDARK